MTDLGLCFGDLTRAGCEERGGDCLLSNEEPDDFGRGDLNPLAHLDPLVERFLDFNMPSNASGLVVGVQSVGSWCEGPGLDS